MNKNFGEETHIILLRNHYNIEDIDWIGTLEFKIPIDQFFKVADNTEYDAGYGAAYMPMDLIIYMKDGSHFYRNEYDGSEWWELFTPIQEPKFTTALKVDRFYPPEYGPSLAVYTYNYS